jgi:membrane-anchored glycerophosphoryl diester phosphodiesterase (GDPDase)
VAYVKCTTQYKDAVEQTMQQIDVIKRMIDQYSDEMQYVTTAQGIYLLLYNLFDIIKIKSLYRNKIE